MLNIVTDFVRFKRPQVKAGRDPLGQLAHLLAIQNLQQFRLPEQHDLQQLVAIGFKVGEQAQLLQDIHGEVLCFINNENRFAPGGVGIQQVSVKPVNQLFDAAVCRVVYAQFITDGFEKLYNG